MDQSIVGTVILLITGLISYKGLKDTAFFEHYIFHVDKILINKEYHRIISSGFLHSGIFHFAFNMIGLITFAVALESLFGVPQLLLLYFGSMVGGSLLALYLHRNHGDYRAVGASGAVSGIIFSSIILYPEHPIRLILIPYDFKSWILGVIFVIISIWGIKSQRDNIGHDAHLGGALTGMIITFLLNPSRVAENWWIFLLLGIPTVLFLMLIVWNPSVLMVEKYWGENVDSIKERFKNSRNKKEALLPQEEMDIYLDKIKKSGFKSLTPEEKERINVLRDKIG